MDKRTWLVTGCSTGFGRALATVLLQRGERVVVTARQRDTLIELVAKHGRHAHALELDITHENDIARAVQAAVDAFGPIDVLVNNAGYGLVGTVEETSIDSARAVMETNFFGTLAMIRAVLPSMIERKAGQIVNIGSVAGQIGFPLLSYYSASKFALAGLTESLAAELRGLGIKVTLAELGPFATNFTRSMAVTPPASHYDPPSLSRTAGNDNWGAGDDPRAGAMALVAALETAEPPVRLILGRLGLEVTALHDARRANDRSAWMKVSQL
jgi:short-subunit dehydrogenase